ncbi:hypothetical protein GRJ2_001743600 [Grus japonensis]|uniref:Reverse transcriptase domain-containing protein n=1 Tax=Grus japonensis TaxID=30415 RepID=A0ABC9X512_GRUJA
MKLSLLLSLTVAVYMVPLFPTGLGLHSHQGWLWVRTAMVPEGLKQPPVVAESTASKWTSIIGLRSPQSWVRVRMAVVPEGRKQPPVVAESTASKWTSIIGLRSPKSWVRVRMAVVPEGCKQRSIVAKGVAAKWSSTISLHNPQSWLRVRMAVVPEGWKQRSVVTERMAAKWSSTISLHNPQSWVRVRMAVVPEGRKQRSVVTERMAAKWSSTIGLHNPQSWVRVRMAVVPEGRKQQPIGTESMASDLPYPLGQLWDKLAQEDMAWLLCRACQTVWLLCMAWIVLGLWRNVKRPQAQPPELDDRDGEQNEAPITQGEMVSHLLHHLDTHKSMGLDGTHQRVLRELAEAKPLSIIDQQSWLTEEVPVDWSLANVTPILKEGRKEDPGNYRPVSLTLETDTVMEQIILNAITQHVQDNQAIRPSQHGFMEGKSCLTNLISFYDKVTCLVDEEKAADVVYLDFSKAFDTIFWRNWLFVAWTGICFTG